MIKNHDINRSNKASLNTIISISKNIKTKVLRNFTIQKNQKVNLYLLPSVIHIHKRKCPYAYQLSMRSKIAINIYKK